LRLSGDTPPSGQIVTNPSQPGWNWLIEWKRDSDALYKATGIPRYGSGSPAKKLSKFLGALLDYPIQYEMAQAIMNFVDGL
jgi:hypothetical protein